MKAIVAKSAMMAGVVIAAGCTPTPPPSWKLEPPSARLMQRPQALPEIAEGHDLYQENLRLRAAYAREAGKVVSLQGYVRTVLKKQKGAPQ